MAERLKRVPETNAKLTVSLFQTEVLDELLRSGVGVGVFRRDGRQLRIPYGIRPAPGLPARKPKDAPAAAQGLRFIKWRTHDGLHSAICFTARHDHAGVR